MDVFESLFGEKKENIKETCILMPLVLKEAVKNLSIERLSHGKLYSTGSSTNFTLIRTGVGPAFVGDAVLYLNETKCRNVILFGSCGLVQKSQNLEIGSLVSPHTCYCLESFSQLLGQDTVELMGFHPDKTLYDLLTKSDLSASIRPATCATLGSLKLQGDLLKLFKIMKIEIADMECSSFFSAAKHINRKAIALFYINDIIKEKPFHKNKTPADQQKLLDGIRKGIELLKTFHTC